MYRDHFQFDSSADMNLHKSHLGPTQLLILPPACLQYHDIQMSYSYVIQEYHVAHQHRWEYIDIIINMFTKSYHIIITVKVNSCTLHLKQCTGCPKKGAQIYQQSNCKNLV